MVMKLEWIATKGRFPGLNQLRKGAVQVAKIFFFLPLKGRWVGQIQILSVFEFSFQFFLISEALEQSACVGLILD